MRAFHKLGVYIRVNTHVASGQLRACSLGSTATIGIARYQAHTLITTLAVIACTVKVCSSTGLVCQNIQSSQKIAESVHSTQHNHIINVSRNMPVSVHSPLNYSLPLAAATCYQCTLLPPYPASCNQATYIHAFHVELCRSDLAPASQSGASFVVSRPRCTWYQAIQQFERPHHICPCMQMLLGLRCTNTGSISSCLMHAANMLGFGGACNNVVGNFHPSCGVERAWSKVNMDTSSRNSARIVRSLAPLSGQCDKMTRVNTIACHRPRPTWAATCPTLYNSVQKFSWP